MSTSSKFFIAAAAGFLSMTSLAADSPKPLTTTQALMRQKLEAAHGLLEGVVREDYALIEKNAETLGNISRASTWHKQDSAEFLHYAKSFQLASAYLLEQARAKHLDGVALGYARLTLSCMECHNFVRAGRSR